MPESEINYDKVFSLEVGEVETTPIEVNGQIVNFPVVLDWPIEAQELLAEGKVRQAVVMILEDRPDDLAAFRRVRIRQLTALMEHLAQQAGVTPGEAPSSAA